MVTAFRFPFGNPEPAGENILVANPKTRITANAQLRAIKLKTKKHKHEIDY